MDIHKRKYYVTCTQHITVTHTRCHKYQQDTYIIKCLKRTDQTVLISKDLTATEAVILTELIIIHICTPHPILFGS